MEPRNRLRIILAEKNLKVKDLAEIAGVSPVTASRWVNNKQQPSLKNIYIIADFFDMDICDLLVPREELKKKEEKKKSS